MASLHAELQFIFLTFKFLNKQLRSAVRVCILASTIEQRGSDGQFSTHGA